MSPGYRLPPLRPCITGFIAAYAGDTLWALAAFLGVRTGPAPSINPNASPVMAMAFSVAIELSQLYHAPWIDSIRHTTLGGLILGFGFLWSDLVCYAVGVGLGVAIEITSGIVQERSSVEDGE